MDDNTRRELDDFKVAVGRELEAALTGVAVQIGAVERIAVDKIVSTEKTIGAKISALRWQVVAALVGGQTLAGVLAAVATRDWRTPLKPAAAALRATGLF